MCSSRPDAFRGVLFKPNGSVITYYLKATRVSPKAVKVTLPHSQIIQKGSYDFLIFSAYFAAPCTNKTRASTPSRTATRYPP
jgi:hypothetical protein